MNTTGKVYFAIKTENTDYNEQWFNQFLSLKATEFSQMRERGNVPKSTCWVFSSRDLVNADYSEEMIKLIKQLSVYEKEFINLKRTDADLSFVLQIVIHLGEETPALSFNLDVLSFVNKVGAIIDCDIYNNSH